MLHSCLSLACVEDRNFSFIFMVACFVYIISILAGCSSSNKILKVKIYIHVYFWLYLNTEYNYHQILSVIAEETYEILSFDTVVFKNKHYCRWKEKIWFKDVWRWVNADWTESQRQALVYFWQVG